MVCRQHVADRGSDSIEIHCTLRMSILVAESLLLFLLRSVLYKGEVGGRWKAPSILGTLWLRQSDGPEGRSR